MDNKILYLTDDMDLIHSYTYLKNKYKIEYISSIIFAILTVLLLKEKIWLYPLFFIIVDFLTICSYKIMNYIFKNKYNMMELRDKKDYLIKNLTCLRKYCDNNYIGTNKYLLAKQAKRQTEDNIEKIINYIKTQQTKPESPEIQDYLQAFNSFKESLIKIDFKVNKDLCSNLLDKLKNIIDIIKESPQKTIFTNKIFNIYLPEINTLLNDLTDSDKINELLKDFHFLLEDVLTTIKEVDSKNSDITIEVLKKEFKQNREELRGDN